MMKFPISECPHCGATEFMQMLPTRGVTCIVFNSDGTEADNSQSGIDSELRYENRVWWHCAKCEKRIFKDSEVEQ